MPVYSEPFPLPLPSPCGASHFHTLAHTPACPVKLISGGPLKSAVVFPTLHPWALPHSTPGSRLSQSHQAYPECAREGGAGEHLCAERVLTALSASHAGERRVQGGRHPGERAPPGGSL